MSTQGDSLLKKTQRGLSILAFETTKQSRILKKRMRTAALQKEIKADLRDLGNLVYNAVVHEQSGILEEEEVKILVDNIRQNKDEVEHLRDGIARLSRTKKHFPHGEDEEAWGEGPEPTLDEPAAVVVESSTAPPPAADEGVQTERELKADILQAPPPEAPAPKKTSKKTESKEPAVPPAPGTDPEHPEAGKSRTKADEKPKSEDKPKAEKKAEEAKSEN